MVEDKNMPKTKAAKDSKQRRDTLRDATPSSLTAEERKLIQEMYKYARSKSIETGEQWDVDHIVPLAKGGLHTPDNLQILPKSVNQKKGDNFDGSGKPEKGAILHTTIQKIIEKEQKKRSGGKFKPGVSGNPAGRPKKIVEEAKVSGDWIKSFNEWADSIPKDTKEWQFQRLYVDLIRELGDPKEILKIMDKLAPYFIIKKKEEDNKFTKVEFNLVMPEEYAKLEKKYSEAGTEIPVKGDATNNKED